QFGLKQLVVPWYMPILGTVGVLLMAASLRQRTTLWRTVGVGLFALLGVVEWYFLLSFTRVPAYRGPAEVGRLIPPFATTTANGRTFTDQDLQDGTPTALVFFRGRW